MDKPMKLPEKIVKAMLAEVVEERGGGYMRPEYREELPQYIVEQVAHGVPPRNFTIANIYSK